MPATSKLARVDEDFELESGSSRSRQARRAAALVAENPVDRREHAGVAHNTKVPRDLHLDVGRAGELDRQSLGPVSTGSTIGAGVSCALKC